MLECVIAFMVGATFGMMITVIFAVGGRCDYERSVRRYYEKKANRRDKHA